MFAVFRLFYHSGVGRSQSSIQEERDMKRSAGFFVMLIGSSVLFFQGCATEKKMLWNERDFSGWEFVLEADSIPARDVWSVKDGVILCKGVPNGYMRTKESYSDFRLHLEWRWPEKGYNSGVFLRIQQPDRVWPNCIECQLYSGEAGDFVLIGRNRLTVHDSTFSIEDKWQVIRGKRPGAENAVGEWNSYDIEARGGRVSCRVNGVLQNEGRDALLVSGPVGLQSEGGPIEFRNIWIQNTGAER
jgi:hypothetical protein